MNDQTMLALFTPPEVAELISNRVRTLRLEKGWTRNTLALRAGVSAASLKRFETDGKASLDLVLKVAHALARLDEFDRLFLPAPAESMEELERRTERPARKRGHR